jgi:spore maturation protein CgeB
MKFVLFYHSLTSDWNHGNAHFLRGIATELVLRGHDVRVYEPADGWSLTQLLRTEGQSAVEGFSQCYPSLRPVRYTLDTLDLHKALDKVDAVIVHEWNPVELLERIGRHRRSSREGYQLLFHDTHHRAVSAPRELARYPLEDFDGTLAFGETIADIYRRRGWGGRVWVWHEAADTRIFKPAERPPEAEAELAWIGNWGDEERSAELRTYLFEPVRKLGISGSVYGVRYPKQALEALERSGLRYRGWVANYSVPSVFHRHRFTVHVPRKFYRTKLPGIPTIRVFEALACGIPLLSAPWSDAEGLFRPGRDFVMVRDGAGMQKAMRDLLGDRAMADEIAMSGRARIEQRHTCAHRVDELLAILHELQELPVAASS